MNRKGAIAVTIVIFAILITGVFAESISPSSPSRGTLQTTSTDIQVVKFEGVGVPQSNFNVMATDGLAVGNLTAAFSFTPETGLQQINSVRATIIYHAAQFYATCNPCYSGDRFNILVNGQLVSDTPVAVSTYPQAAVVTLGNLHAGSNLMSLDAVNPTAQAPGIYWIYEVRLTVEYTFLA